MPLPRPRTLLLLVLALAACERAPDNDVQQVAQSSELYDPWQVDSPGDGNTFGDSSTPVMHVEEAYNIVAGALPTQPEFDLTHVESAVEFSDGSLLTFTTYRSRLLRFGTDGRGIEVIGAVGEGPGQFMRASELVPLAGDTAVLIDGANLRINYITPGSGVVRMVGIGDGFPVRPTHAGGALSSGPVLVGTHGVTGRGVADTVTRPPATFLLITSGGAVREFAVRPDLETIAMPFKVQKGVGMSSNPLAFGLHASAVAWGNRIAIASSADYRVELLDTTGAVVGEIARQRPRRVVTAPMRDSVVTRALAALNDITEEVADMGALERQARATPVADSFPPIEELMVSSDGILWVLDPVAPGDPGWTATGFRHDLSVYAKLRSGVRGTPLRFGADHVLLRVEDADGVVSIRRHRFGG